jgi:hypothetical protein
VSDVLYGIVPSLDGCGCRGPRQHPIAIARGSDRELLLIVQDAAGKTVDLTGATLTLTAKARLGATAALITKISSDVAQIDIFDPTGGRAHLFFVPADTDALPANDYPYDIWLTVLDGEKYQIVPVSVLTVEQPVT